MPSNISNEAPRSALKKTGQPHLEAGRPLEVSGPALARGRDDDQPPLREPLFLRFPDLKTYGVPYSRQHIDTLEREGRFPKRVKLSAGVVVWRLTDVRAWLAERSA